MPNDLTHPAPEQLAAYAAGGLVDLDRAGIATHLAGCQACAAEAEAIEAVTADLAALDEPEPPPGFHDRLMAAVHAELDHPEAAAPAHVGLADLGARRARARRQGVGNRVLAWGAVAAAVLVAAVVGVTQLTDHPAGDATTAAAPAPKAGSTHGAEGGAALSASGGAAGIPVFRLAGDLDLASLRSAVSSSPQLQAAYQFAAAEAAGLRGSRQPGAADATATQAGGTAPPALDRCLTAAGPGARPAFFVEGVYQGRPATILVTLQPGGQLGLYVFGRGDCTRLLDSGSTKAPPTSAP